MTYPFKSKALDVVSYTQMNEQKIVIVVQSFLLQILMDTFQGFQGSRRRCLENMSGESISNT